MEEVYNVSLNDADLTEEQKNEILKELEFEE